MHHWLRGGWAPLSEVDVLYLIKLTAEIYIAYITCLLKGV